CSCAIFGTPFSVAFLGCGDNAFANDPYIAACDDEDSVDGRLREEFEYQCFDAAVVVRMIDDEEIGVLTGVPTYELDAFGCKRIVWGDLSVVEDAAEMENEAFCVRTSRQVVSESRAEPVAGESRT